VCPECPRTLQLRRELGGYGDPRVTAEDANVVDMVKRNPALLIRVRVSEQTGQTGTSVGN
jgi:hypothetical protein